MNSKQIIEGIVKIYKDVIPEDDVKNRTKIDAIFKNVEFNRNVGLDNLYVAIIRANGVLGGKYDALRHFKTVREFLEQHFDKTYLGVLSVDEKPSYRDRNTIRDEILTPAAEANMKAQGMKAPQIRKTLNVFKIDDWFFDLANFIANYALLRPSFFDNKPEFLTVLKAKIAQHFVGMLPSGLTLEYLELVRQAVVDKVLNKNLK